MGYPSKDWEEHICRDLKVLIKDIYGEKHPDKMIRQELLLFSKILKTDQVRRGSRILLNSFGYLFTMATNKYNRDFNCRKISLHKYHEGMLQGFLK